jgi:hypothetical protein
MLDGVAPDRSKNSHAFENMIEHVFLAQLLEEMWFGRNQVLEVAKADVDSWGYDVILSTESRTRYVQLKTSVPVDVNLRLFGKPGACIVAAIPGQTTNGMKIDYRFWEIPKNGKQAAATLRASKRSVYRRGQTSRDERQGHRRVPMAEFTKPMDINELARRLFPSP